MLFPHSPLEEKTLLSSVLLVVREFSLWGRRCLTTAQWLTGFSYLENSLTNGCFPSPVTGGIRKQGWYRTMEHEGRLRLHKVVAELVRAPTLQLSVVVATGILAYGLTLLLLHQLRGR